MSINFDNFEQYGAVHPNRLIPINLVESGGGGYAVHRYRVERRDKRALRTGVAAPFVGAAVGAAHGRSKIKKKLADTIRRRGKGAVSKEIKQATREGGKKGFVLGTLGGTVYMGARLANKYKARAQEIGNRTQF